MRFSDKYDHNRETKVKQYKRIKITCTGETQRGRTHARGRVSRGTRLRLHSVIAYIQHSYSTDILKWQGDTGFT
jgi:hypothetical protein